MKAKKALLAVALFAAGISNAQITPSVTVPNPLPNYDGSYDDFGRNHLFYPNAGEVRFAEDWEDAGEIVKFYTMNTYPKKFLMADNNLSFVHFKPKAGSAGADSLQRIDLEWAGSRSSAFLARVDTQNMAMLNYFTQWFGSAGRTDVKGGAAIVCQSIYPNTDLVYTSNNAGLVMYFVIYPGGNYNSIRMHVNGSRSNSIVSNKLRINANWESTSFERPEMYQYTISGGVVSPVNVGIADWQAIGTDLYKINSTSGFSSSLPLIIQIRQAPALVINTPGLLWSTYFGGNQFEFMTKTHTDASDNLYIAGYSNSALNFPQGQGVTPFANNNGDATIAKFKPSGELHYSAFVGGSSRDEIHDFAFSGNDVFCVGRTNSDDLTTVIKSGASPNNSTFGGGTWDGFIWQFSFNGLANSFSTSWLTYYGGSGDDELNACAFDASGNFYVAGASATSNLSLINPGGGAYQQSYNTQSSASGLSTDGIIAKFNSASAQVWFTYYGTDQLGTNAHSFAADYFYGMTVSGNDVYVCGKSGGTNLPNSLNAKFVSGDFDGILVHFSTAGVLASSGAKYTNGNNVNYAVKVHWGEVYTVGETNNSAMVTANSGQYPFQGALAGTLDACYSVHPLNLSVTTHNSYLGGSADDAAYDIDFSNNLVLVAGGTNSSDFPTNNLLSNMFNSAAAGLNDNYLFCMQKGNPASIWSSYLGSNYQESLQFPPGMLSQFDITNTTISVDSQNRIHLLGTTNSYNTFPLSDGGGPPCYFQGVKSGFGPGGTNDATVTRFDVAGLSTIIGLADFEKTGFVFGLYPNPTARDLYINHSALVNVDLRYAIYDMSGKKLREGSLNASEAKRVDVSTLPRGVYIINVSNGAITFSNRFFKSEH